MTNSRSTIQTEGNGAALLLVDSGRRAEYEQVAETMISALQHMGIPYRICDISKGFPSSEQLKDIRCLVIGQHGLGKALDESGTGVIKKVVHNGVGLVHFDGCLRDYDSSLFEIFGVLPRQREATIKQINTVNTEHFITATRELTDDIILTTPLTIHPMENPVYGNSKTRVLLESSSKWPLLTVNNYGKGRVVLLNCPVSIWTKEVLGHVSGLDDVFWKAIVWAAKKPFAIHPMPPFTTAIVDDCGGSHNHFRYADTMNKYGWLPHLELFLDDIDRIMHDKVYLSGKKIRTLYDDGLAEFGVHGFTYDDLMWFDHRGQKPLSDQRIKENFKRYDEHMRKWGIRPAKFENPHFSEIGLNALPYLKERGVEYLSVSLDLGAGWFSSQANAPVFTHYPPYLHQNYYMGYLREDPDFFVLSSKLRPFARASSDAVPEVDFLWNHTIFWDENPVTEVEGAIRVGVKQIRRGVDARFFGNLLCHEQRIAVIPMSEWEEIISGIRRGLAKYRLISRPLDYVCDYAKSLFNTALHTVHIDEDSGRLACEFVGKADVATMLEIYTNEGHDVHCECRGVPPFSGRVKVTC